MKLYAIQPDGHGQKSFFVCAENVIQAIKAINSYARKNDIELGDEYRECKQLDPLVVIENDND